MSAALGGPATVTPGEAESAMGKKKPYVKPKIVGREPLEVIAAACHGAGLKSLALCNFQFS